MSFFSSIKSFFGIGDDDKKKKQQQQQSNQNYNSYQAPQKPGSVVAPNRGQNQPQQVQTNQQPDNGVNLALPGQTRGTPAGFPEVLKKPQTAPTSAQQTTSPGTTENLLQKVVKVGKSVGNSAIEGERQFAKGIARVLPGGTADMDANNKMSSDAADRAAQAVRDLKAGKISKERAQAITRDAAGTTDQAVQVQKDIEKSMPTKASIALGAASTAADIVTAGSASKLKSGKLAGFGETIPILGEAGRLTKGANIAGRAISNAAAGGLNAAASNAGGNDKQDVATAAITGAALPEVLRGIGKGLTKFVPGANKATPEVSQGVANAVDKPEVAPGVRSANPNIADDATAAAVDNTPAYQRRAPSTVGQADAQAQNGIYNVPDSALSADARVSAGPAPDPLDVPTFMRRSADTNLQKGTEAKAAAEARAAAIQDNMGQTRKFNDKQVIADAFAESPQKGQATARLIADRNSRIDPEQNLRDALTARGQAEAEIRSAQEAKAAQDALDAQAATPAPAPSAQEPTIAELAGQNSRPEAVLQKAIEDAHNAGDNAKVAELITQLPAEMQPSMRSALGVPEPTPAANTLIPEMPNDTSVPPAAPAATPVETPPNVTSQEPLLNKQLPETPAPDAPATADVAPRSHDALVKSLGPVADEMKGRYSKRTPLNLDELKQNAAGAIANMSDEDLTRAFASTGADTMIKDSQSFALARAALERFSQMSDDPAAVQQVVNIMDAMDRYVSKSGEGLRIAQEEFDNMPLPMKVRYIVKKIDAANVNTKNYQALADDPAKAAVVEANITGHLQASQTIAERVSKLEGQLNQVADAAKNGERSNADIKGLTAALQTERTNLARNNGELAKYYSTLIPKRSLGNRVLSDFPRRMMLASFTGRLNDIITTGANIANLSLDNFTQGILNKGVNMVKGAGTVTDTFKGGSKLFKGAIEGAKKTVGEIRGDQYAGDLQKAITSNVDGRSGLQKSTGRVGRTIQAATEAATNLSEGVRDQRVYQLADQEAAKAGLTGELRRQYAEARSAVPSRQMQEQADLLHKQINNLNENLISRTLNRVAASIEGTSALGGLIKNQVMPFTSWLGGNIWNSLTDRNVVASAAKLTRDLARGDTENATRNLAKTINGAAQAYALGYVLTQQGYLTNEDAQGYSDNGTYFHIKDRYIPVGFLGFFAPNIVLGNAAYHGMNDPENTNPAEKIASTLEHSFVNMGKSISVTSALGADNNLQRFIDAGTQPGHGAQDGPATFGAGIIGQYIPAAQGDVNAMLNNGVPLVKGSDALNPTHEAADTKVVNPNSPSGNAKDVPKSALQGLKNRIPFLSQTLPRKQNVAAADLVDRTTRGNRDTAGGKADRQQKQAAVDQTADFKKRGVPDYRGKNFDDAVKARTEAGDWDKAIEGLQAKLDSEKGNNDIPQSKKDDIANQIKVLEVHKSGNFDPKVADLYKKTSLSEWRDLGDPESDTYDPKKYQLLFDYDKQLAAAGVSRNTDDTTNAFYSAKKQKSGSGSGRSKKDPNLTRIQSNTVSSPSAPSSFKFDIPLQKAGSIKMPEIQQIRSSDLVKKRKISVKG